MAENPACAINDAFGVKILNTYTGRTRIGRVPLTSSVVLSGSVVQFVDGVAVAPGATYAWFEAPGVRTLVVIQEVDPLDSVLKNSVYIDWSIDLTIVLPGTSSVFQIGHNLNGVAITHCIFMPDADTFFAKMYIGDQANGIWSFDPLDVAGTIAKIITTEGTGANPGRMAWNSVLNKLVWVDARGADVELFLYTADGDGTNVAKIGAGVGAGVTFDSNDNVQYSVNGRYIYNTTDKHGSMDTDGTNQTNYSTSNFVQKDLAPTNVANEVYVADSNDDIQKIDFVTGVGVLVLTGTAPEVITDGANLSDGLCYYRQGNTLRRVDDDGSNDQEVWDGAPIANLQVVIGIDEGRIWFVYDASSETHIGSVTIAGGDFQSAGRIDLLAAINWAGTCATVSS